LVSHEETTFQLKINYKPNLLPLKIQDGQYLRTPEKQYE
jgi:hypothetical protein